MSPGIPKTIQGLNIIGHICTIRLRMLLVEVDPRGIYQDFHYPADPSSDKEREQFIFLGDFCMECYPSPL